MPRFNLAGYVKEKKRLRQEIVMNNRGITELEDELSVVTLKKQNKTKELSRVKAKCRRLDEKVLLLCFNLCHTSCFAASHFATHTIHNPTENLKT
jgi:hypothetical protein